MKTSKRYREIDIDYHDFSTAFDMPSVTSFKHKPITTTYFSQKNDINDSYKYNDVISMTHEETIARNRFREIYLRNALCERVTDCPANNENSKSTKKGYPPNARLFSRTRLYCNRFGSSRSGVFSEEITSNRIQFN